MSELNTKQQEALKEAIRVVLETCFPNIAGLQVISINATHKSAYIGAEKQIYRGLSMQLSTSKEYAELGTTSLIYTVYNTARTFYTEFPLNVLPFMKPFASVTIAPENINAPYQPTEGRYYTYTLYFVERFLIEEETAAAEV